MTPLPEKVREHRRIVIDAVIILMVVVLMVQMWLLTAALEAYLAGHMDAALPGAAVSAALFEVLEIHKIADASAFLTLLPAGASSRPLANLLVAGATLAAAEASAESDGQQQA